MPCKYNFITQQFINIKSAVDYNIVGGVAVPVGTDIYLFGGSSFSSLMNISANAYKYDTLTDTYTQLRSLPERRFGMCGCAVNNDIYLIGGCTQSNGIGTTGSVWRYSIADDTYTSLANFPSGTGKELFPDSWRGTFSMDMSAVPFGNKIYIFGGRYSGNRIHGYITYDIDTNQYSTYKTVEGLRGMCPPAVVGTRVYFFSFKDTPITIFDLTTEEIIETSVVSPKAYGHNGAYFYKDKIYLPYTDRLDVLTVKGSEYENDSVVLAQNNNADSQMATELITVPHFINRMRFRFSDAFYYSKENGIDATIPTYYGDGTQWIKFKN